MFCELEIKNGPGISNGISYGRKGEQHVMSWMVRPVSELVQFSIKVNEQEIANGSPKLFDRQISKNLKSSGIIIGNSVQFNLTFKHLRYEDDKKYLVIASPTADCVLLKNAWEI